MRCPEILLYKIGAFLLKTTSDLSPSRPVQPAQRWRLRAVLLVFLCVLLLWTDIFAGWTATPAHAATVSNPNPVLKAPSALQSPAPVVPHVLASPGNGSQTITTGPIPRPTLNVVPPQSVVLTTAAQQVMSGNGTFELDIAAGSVSAAQIQAAGGAIRLTVNQTDPGSGGDASGRVFLGTYQLQLANAADKPLTTLVLAHPFTLRYHAPTALQGWFWQDQEVTAIWQPVSATQASVGTRALALPSSSASQVLLARKDAPTTAVWSVSTNLGAASAGVHSAVTTPQSLLPAAASSTVTFNTEDPTASWGKAHDVDVGLSSGSVDYSYPLSIPPGPGGLTPPVNLAYSSGSVNETHNVQAAAPWVGEGWSLSLGSISWSEQNVTEGLNAPTWESVWNINDSNGLSGQLIPPDQKASTQNPTPVPAMSALPAVWHTAPESHSVVQEVDFKGGPCWHVWLPDGTMEEFGCVDPARQGAVDALGTFNTYRWDLDLIVDRYGNQIRINYQRNYPGGNVRDAVISSIEYDDPSCHNTTFTNASAQCASWHPQVRLVFDASMKPAHLTNTTGCQNWTSTAYRCDDPVDLTSSKGLGIAKAINTYVLNDVQVLVNGHTLRQYIFSYDQGGPQTRVDQLSGSSESIAGYLNLTKIQQLGTDVNGLSAPVTTMSYINTASVQQHYIDKLFGSNTKSPCPSTIPRFNSTQCVLWEQSYNSSYLSSLDNGMGWHATLSWKEAHNNTHGAVGNDAFACDAPGAQTPTSLCGSADDENWSRIVLVGRTEVTNGVSSTWGYQYTVAAISAQQCSDCQHGYTWGNQNDNDYTDYYNGQFTSFTKAQVTNPDKSYQLDYFASTPGWGEANSSIHCYTKYACHPAPYWNEDPGAAGKLNQEEDYSASGQLMQVTSNTYAMNCPPLGVVGSKNAVGGTVDPGSGYLFSELDHNNPVVVCDPRVTQTDSYQVDGVTDISGYKSDARVVHKTVTTSYDGDDQGVAAYDYGNVNSVDTTGNDVGGQQFVQTTSYFPDNNVNGNVYLTDLPAFVQNRDASGTIDGCQVYVYGGNSSPPHAPVVPSVTLQAGFVDATNCGGTASATLHSYDSSGNPITATDPDGHQGCTSGSGQYSACASYDGSDTHLTRALNAKNQAVSYRYDLSQASSGYGQWLMSTTDANGQTTTFTYDTLGRLTSEIKPGDTQSQPTVSYTYTNTCRVGTTSPCLELDTTTRVTSGSNTTTTSRAWYDGMGRVVETQAPGPNEFSKLPATGSLLVSYTLYDTMGRATTTKFAVCNSGDGDDGVCEPGSDAGAHGDDL